MKVNEHLSVNEKIGFCSIQCDCAADSTRVSKCFKPLALRLCAINSEKSSCYKFKLENASKND